MIYEGAFALDFLVNVFRLNLSGERIDKFFLAEFSRENGLILAVDNLLDQHWVVVLVSKATVVCKFHRA